jgi:dimeric dUTPase (all-alpha-NTP-PPase superfamily)
VSATWACYTVRGAKFKAQNQETAGRSRARQKLFSKRQRFVLAFTAAWRLNSRMEKPDQLRELFRMQKSLNERIGVKTDGMTEEEKTKWILNYCRAMSQEMAELTDSVPWKWWAKYQKFDEQNARVEVVDLFHFLISMAQVLGMSADDVFAAYVKKNEVNFKRQETGYVKKDENDSKHI